MILISELLNETMFGRLVELCERVDKQIPCTDERYYALRDEISREIGEDLSAESIRIDRLEYTKETAELLQSIDEYVWVAVFNYNARVNYLKNQITGILTEIKKQEYETY